MKNGIIILLTVILLSGCAGVINQENPDNAEIVLESGQSPESVGFNELATIEATVINEGNVSGSADVVMKLSDEEIYERAIQLDEGESKAVVGGFNASDFPAGEHEITLIIDGQSYTNILEIREKKPASIEIVDVDAQNQVEYLSDYSVTVEVKNSGDETGSSDVVVQIQDEEYIEHDISVSAGENNTVTIVVDNLEMDGGESELVVRTSDDSHVHKFDLIHPSHYQSTTVDLYVEDSMMEFDADEIVDESIEFWETDGAEHLDFDVTYNLVESEADADKVLEFNDVTMCGHHIQTFSMYLGCADLVEETVDWQVKLDVQYNMSKPLLRDTLKHELGHTLGLTHDDEPQNIMSDEIDPYLRSGTVNVYISSPTGNLPSTIEREIEAAFDYLTQESDLDIGTELNYEVVDSPEDAHITVTYDSDAHVCGFSVGGSCTTRGEYYAQENAQLDDLDSQVVRWHTTYQLAPIFFDEIPDELSADTSRRDRERF